ncbi:hypothetical protein, partial [Amycolatopsis samaneae]
MTTHQATRTVVRYRLHAGFTVDSGLRWPGEILDEDSGLDLDGDGLLIRIGRRVLPIPLSTVAGAEVTDGCLSRERGVRLSPGHGLLVRTTTLPGVRIRCHEPVPG